MIQADAPRPELRRCISIMNQTPTTEPLEVIAQSKILSVQCRFKLDGDFAARDTIRIEFLSLPPGRIRVTAVVTDRTGRSRRDLLESLPEHPGKK